jgi:phage repressor protein C with HTH and peptisase S24 domain
VVTALAAETEIPLPWIVSGRAMPRKLAIVPGHHDIPAFAEPGAEFIDDVPVQMLALKAAAGRGALMLDDSASHHYFPRAILQSYGVATQHARLMMASGLSMIPTINDGDLMLVDVSPAAAGQIVDGKIYVFALGNEAYVKRLRRSGVKVVMISDNRDMFPPEDAPEEPPMTIYGMVKWAGRGV